MLGGAPLSGATFSSLGDLDLSLDLVLHFEHQYDPTLATSVIYHLEFHTEHQYDPTINTEIALDLDLSFAYRHLFGAELSRVRSLQAHFENQWGFTAIFDFETESPTLKVPLMPGVRYLDVHFSRDDDTLVVALLPSTRNLEA